jgi:hypothetical protein
MLKYSLCPLWFCYFLKRPSRGFFFAGAGPFFTSAADASRKEK